MKKNIFSIIIIYLLFSNSASIAQTNNELVGARAMSMGGTGILLLDEFSLENNPAAASKIKEFGLSTYFLNRFYIASLNTIGLHTYMPLKKFVTGLFVKKFGDKYYSEQSIGIGLAHTMGIVSLGMSTQLVQIGMHELPTRYAWLGCAGGIAEIGSKIKWAARIWNFNNAHNNTVNEIAFPVVISTGISYQPTELVLLCAELEKNIQHPAVFKFGIDYKVGKILSVRTGFLHLPTNITFGTGLLIKKSKFDYAFLHHSILGSSHQLSLSISLGRPIAMK
jgi:hypothetical protein